MEGCRWEGQNLQPKEVQRLIKGEDINAEKTLGREEYKRK